MRTDLLRLKALSSGIPPMSGGSCGCHVIHAGADAHHVADASVAVGMAGKNQNLGISGSILQQIETRSCRTGSVFTSTSSRITVCGSCSLSAPATAMRNASSSCSFAPWERRSKGSRSFRLSQPRESLGFVQENTTGGNAGQLRKGAAQLIV